MFKRMLFSIYFLISIILGIHVIALYFFNFQLQESLLYAVKMTFISLGVIIALTYFKKLSWKQYYFNLFPIGCIIYILAYLLKGFLGGIILSTISYLIIGDKVVYTEDDITIYLKYTGPFAMCCEYKIAEKSMAF